MERGADGIHHAAANSLTGSHNRRRRPLVTNEPQMTLMVAAIIRAHPEQAAHAFTAHGIPCEWIDPSSVAVESPTNRGGTESRGRIDILATTDLGPLVIEGKLGALPDVDQVRDYLEATPGARAALLVADLNIDEARSALATLPEVTIVGVQALLNEIDAPIATELGVDLAALGAAGSPMWVRSVMQASINRVGRQDVDAAIADTASGFPSIDLTHLRNSEAFGQVEKERGGEKFVATVGIRITSKELASEVTRAEIRKVLLAAGPALDEAGIGYRRTMHRSPIHTTLDMTDAPWLSRGYSSGQGGYYLGVKIQGDDLSDTVALSIRALQEYAQLCAGVWPNSILDPDAD